MSEKLNNEIAPIFKDNYTAIVVNSSDFYVPYLSVYLQSIKDNSSADHNYDVVVCESSISDLNKVILKKHFEISNNLSLRFFNPSQIFENCNLHVSHNYLCKESYYRLAAALIFKDYKKIIYTDADLIFTTDPQKLYNLDVSNNSILSVLEPIWSYWINYNANISGVNINKYSKNILKLKDLHRYFNTGVMLMNIDFLKENNYSEQMTKKLTTQTKYLYQDQCVLNEVLQDTIGVLPWAWNQEILGSNVLKYAQPFFKEYCNTNEDGIIHFIGGNKPWKEPQRAYSYLWWEYARKTPFYEVILERMLSASTLNKKALIEAIKFRSNILYYWKYKILFAFSFGKKKEYYRNEKLLWKEKVRLGKDFRRG